VGSRVVAGWQPGEAKLSLIRPLYYYIILLCNNIWKGAYDLGRIRGDRSVHDDHSAAAG